MLKYVFAFIVIMHGLIHLMGFGKAFGYGNIPQLSKHISKPIGSLWLFTAILFVFAVVFYLTKKESWWMIAIPALLFSQALIFMFWKDAKMGTVANLIILIPLIIAAANQRFHQRYQKEVQQLLLQPVSTATTPVTQEMISHLPPVVQKWLTHSGVIGTEKTQRVYLQQAGEMMNKPGGKWIPFTAEEYFITDRPAFNWRTTIQPSSIFLITGRDKYEDGKGHMLIKAYSLFPVVDIKGKEADQGSLLRYLAEVAWFPSAAVNNYIQWEAVDSLSAKATITYGGITASGIFFFTDAGDMAGFEADRYYIDKNRSALEKWQVSCKGYKVFNGISIPYKSELTWKLKEGDYTWMKMEITSIACNTAVTLSKKTGHRNEMAAKE
jgi:hypothetical protein